MSNRSNVDAVVSLVNSLKNRRPGTRRIAARALGRLNLDPDIALRQFGKALKDRDSAVRLAAVKDLGKVGPRAVALLTEALSSRDKYVRR